MKRTMHTAISGAAFAAVLAIGASAQAADEAAPSALQARLDALQQITVTEAREPAADVATATPAVQAVLDAAAVAEDNAAATGDAAPASE